MTSEKFLKILTMNDLEPCYLTSCTLNFNHFYRQNSTKRYKSDAETEFREVSIYSTCTVICIP